MSVILVVVIRSLISFFFLLILVRLTGKQQLSELTYFDYVVGITIGSIAATLSVTINQNTTATLTGMTIWSLLPILLAYISLHNIWVRKVVEGEATVVIENGKVLERQLGKLRLSIDDLLSQLRSKNVFNIADIEFAIFETSGKLSVQLKSQKQPLTPEDLNLPTRYKGLCTTIIDDGKILIDALKSLGLTKAWLYFQLNKQNIKETSEVALAQLDTTGNLYVDLKSEQLYYIISTTDGREM
jgi:uncharacterized membrane protein YcaP (DUF421 family)